jgi:MATE family multidrug resistance protein
MASKKGNHSNVNHTGTGTCNAYTGLSSHDNDNDRDNDRDSHAINGTTAAGDSSPISYSSVKYGSVNNDTDTDTDGDAGALNDVNDVLAGYPTIFYALRHSSECRSLMKETIVEIASLAWPIVLAYLLQFSLNTVNFMFLGHLESRYLAACALANMYANVTGYSLMFGLSSAAETLCSQAYGDKQYKQMTIWALRTSLFLLVCTIPVYLMWSFSEDLLVLAGQQADIAKLSGEFLHILSFGMLPLVLYEVLKKWCQAQHVVKLFVVSGIAANICNVIACYLLIYTYDFGFIGAAISTSLSNWFMLLVGVFCIWYMGYLENAWPQGLAITDLFTGWSEMVKLGVPGMIMICVEWWIFEILALAAGHLGVLELDTFVICLNIITICFCIPLGIGMSASIIVGNSLGAGQYSMAKFASLCSVIVGGGVAFCSMSLLLIFRYQLGAVFSNDQSVVESVAMVLPFCAIEIFIEGIQGVCGGILRGAGKQTIGAIANIIAYWAICLPAAVFLAFHGHGVRGLIIGLISGIASTFLICTFSIGRLNWQLESEKAKERLNEEASSSMHLQQDEDEDEGVPYTNVDNGDSDMIHNV